jgi:hypothetical protein
MNKPYIFLLSVLISGFTVSCGTDSSEEKAVAEVSNTKDIQKEFSGKLEMPEDMSHLRDNLERHLGEVFNDSNKYQYAHAVSVGIEPIRDVRSAYYTSRPLIKVVNTNMYRLDSLTHSVPYLVPEAYALLEDIGKNFQDSLRKHNKPACRLKITSLLRTPASVKRLRRSNRNATDSSAHQFATTFDISYNGFYKMNSEDQAENVNYRKELAEVLYDLRQAKRCMVKYERKSPCFHITVINR